jgi:hypothetical protein
MGIFVVGGSAEMPPSAAGATKGFLASWGIIKLKDFIPLARIS